MPNPTQKPKDKHELPKPRKGFSRIYHAFFYSFDGLKYAIVNEAAFRQETILTLILSPMIFIINCSLVEKLIMFGSLIIILITELLNSSIEAIVDKVVDGYDPMAKRAKDMGSAAVLIAIILFLITWSSIIYCNYFIPLFNQ